MKQQNARDSKVAISKDGIVRAEEYTTAYMGIVYNRVKRKYIVESNREEFNGLKDALRSRIESV